MNGSTLTKTTRIACAYWSFCKPLCFQFHLQHFPRFIRVRACLTPTTTAWHRRAAIINSRQDIAVGCKLNTSCVLHRWSPSWNYLMWQFKYLNLELACWVCGISGGWVFCSKMCMYWPKGLSMIRSPTHPWLLWVTAGECKWSEGGNFPRGACYLIG